MLFIGGEADADRLELCSVSIAVVEDSIDGGDGKHLGDTN